AHVGFDDTARPRVMLRGVRALDDLDRVGNRRQRIAQFMGEHGEELVLPAVILPQPFFGTLPIGAVTDNPDEAFQLPGAVVKPLHAAIGPEFRPVLAEMPAFASGAA